jgi:hypothetical protein
MDRRGYQRPRDLDDKIADLKKLRADNESEWRRAAGDPIAAGLLGEFGQVYEQLISAFEEIRALRDELGKIPRG